MRRLGWVASIVLPLALGATESAAVEAVTVTITVASNVWALNGDSVRQPIVPLTQKLATPEIVLTDTAIVNPTCDAVTQLNIRDNFGGTQTVVVSETTGGNVILAANPTNRLDPFTAIFTNRADGDTGTATVFGGPYGGKGGDFPINMVTDICLDKEDTGGFCFFIAHVDLPGALGIREGVAAFTGHVEQLSIPIAGTAFGNGWTTGMLTVSKRVTTMRKFDDPGGTPTGFQTFTFMSTGTFGKNVSTAITPFVVEAFTGVGPNQVPTPFYGFLRGKIEGCTFVPEPRALLMAASVLVLAALGRRSSRSSLARTDPHRSTVRPRTERDGLRNPGKGGQYA
jgi:hypothetical protein